MIEELTSEMNRKFRQQTNVFKNWVGDIDHSSIADYIKNGVPLKQTMSLKSAFNHDIIPRNFKPFFFMPDQQDINKCLDILQKRYKDVKNLFIYLSTSRGESHSKMEYLAYPFVSQDRMKDFLE